MEWSMEFLMGVLIGVMGLSAAWFMGRSSGRASANAEWVKEVERRTAEEKKEGSVLKEKLHSFRHWREPSQNDEPQ